jgi:hypothetical protein
LTTRGSPLFSARSVAVRLRRRAKDSDDKDIGRHWRMDWLVRFWMTVTKVADSC